MKHWPLWIMTAMASLSFPWMVRGADLQPPELMEFDFNPKTVNISGGASTVSITARITDDTGFDYGLYIFMSPSSNQSVFAVMTPTNRISGSAIDGHYQAATTLGPYSQTGTWTLVQISLRDTENNSTNYHGAALQALCTARGFPRELTVNSGSGPDSDPPYMTRLTFSPGVVEVGDGAGIVAVTSTVADALSGVSHAEVRLTAPDYSESDLILFTTNQLVSGTPNNGTYSATLTIPQGSPTGTWTVSRIKMVDRAANAYVVTGAQAVSYCQLMYLSHQIIVESNPTRRPPELIGFDFAPRMMAISNTPATIAVTARVATVEGDFSSGMVTFGSQDESGASVVVELLSLNRMSGDARDGIYTNTFELPAHTAPGIWMVTGVELYDAGGGSLNMFAASALSYMVGRDFPYLITVRPDQADTNAPAITEQLINPGYVDVSTGEKNITISARITDDLSGFSYGKLIFSNPSSNRSVSCDFSPWTRTFGGVNDGWYEDVLTIPQFAESGTWTLSSIELVDHAGKTLNLQDQAAVAYCQALAPALAYTFFVESGYSDLLAPVMGSLSVESAVYVATNDGGGVVATAYVSDDRSGLIAGTISFTSPSGSNSLQADISGSVRISGHATGGVYQAMLGISTNTEKGYWQVSGIELADAAGNNLTMETAAAQAYCVSNGLAKGFSVVSPFEIIDINNSAIRWPSLTGVRYVCEYTDSLWGSWNPLGDAYIGNGAILSVTNDYSSPTNRFYRVKIVPLE